MRLETKNLVLRPYEPEDTPKQLAAIKHSLPQLSRWLDWAQTPPTLESCAATIRMFQEQIASGKEVPLAIFLHDGTFVGSSGYRITNKFIPSFELGYWLDTRHTRKGLMTEAVIAQTGFLFDALNAQRVDIHCHAENTASAKVALTTGFKMEARLKNHRRHVDNKLADTLIFAHTPDTWRTFENLY